MFILQNEITYLGHIITAEGIATDPKKIEAVLKWPQPETVSDVRSFLGFVGYYRRFIKGSLAYLDHYMTLLKDLNPNPKE